jgi:hypothetical protein
MPQHHRVIDWPTVGGGPLVQIAAADSHGGDFEEHILLSNGRLFFFADFDGARFRGKIDDSGAGHGGING